MKKDEFLDYWLSPRYIENIDENIKKNIESGLKQENNKSIQLGKELLKNKKIKDARDFFFDKYYDESNVSGLVYYIAILQNVEPENPTLDEMLVELYENYIANDESYAGNDCKAYYDAVKAYIKKCEKSNEYLNMIMITKGFRYAAYLGYESAFDELIYLCETNLLPGVDSDWANDWRRIKSNKSKANTNAYEEVKELIGNVCNVSDKMVAKENDTVFLMGQSFEEEIKKVCNEFLSCHEKKEFMTANKMIKYFGVSDNETIYIAHDDTLRKNGKNGFIITDKGIYCRVLTEKNTYFTSYKELEAVSKVEIRSSEVFADDHKVAYYCGSTKIRDELKCLFEKMVSVCRDMSNQDISDTVLEQVTEDNQITVKELQMFCTTCGEQIERTAKFCNFCGAKVTYIAKEEK